MAINFEQARYVDPNVDIKGTKIPLATMDKGIEKLDVLYNAARANDTKMAALNKRLLMNAHPGDVEAANAVNEFYNKKLQERIAAGNYEAHVWQTEADANDMAGLYERISQDKELRNKYEADILANNTIDPAEREDLVKMYQKEQAPLAFNSDLQAFNSRNILPYSVAANQDVPKILDSMVNGWLPDTNGTTTVKAGISNGTQTDAYGNIIPAGMKIVTTDKGVTRIAKEGEIESYLRNAVKSHQPIRDMMTQKLKLSLNRKPLAEGETVEMRAAALEKEYIEPGIQFAKEKHGFVDRQTDEKSQILNAQKGKGDGSGDGDTKNPFNGTQDLRTSTNVVKNNFSEAIKSFGNEYEDPTIKKENTSLIKNTLNNWLDSPEYSQLLLKSDRDFKNQTLNSPISDREKEIFNNLNFYAINRKLEKGETLNGWEVKYLQHADEIINGETEHTGASGVRDSAVTFSGPGSPALRGFYQNKYPDQINPDGTFNTTVAIDRDNKYLFGENLDMNDGSGVSHGLKWVALDGTILGSGTDALDKIPESKNSKGEKHRFARIDGIINPHNPAGFEPSHIKGGQKVQGTFDALGQRLVSVSGKQYAVINPEESFVSPESMAVAYGKYMDRDDAHTNIFVETNRGEVPVHVRRENGLWKFTVNGVNRSVNPKATIVPYYLEEDGNGQQVTRGMLGNNQTPVTETHLKKFTNDLQYVPENRQTGEPAFWIGTSKNGKRIVGRVVDAKEEMFSKIIKGEF